jgi:glycosyltransferase involved in cell wall biosynthesis
MFLTPITRNPTADCSLPLPDVSGDDPGTESLFQGQYSIAGCIRKYGAGDYLKVLRKRLGKGLYDRERFCVLAAHAYLWAGKPKRCLSLLNSCMPVAPPKASVHTFRELMDDATCACAEQTNTCSLNMIVKNEEKNIEAALDSIDDIMDEIVVCDTGSSDSTIEIAKTYGATVVVKEWQDDFSMARNAALDMSTGTWVLWLDADDRLEPQSRRRLVNLLETSGPHAAAFRVVNIQDNMQGAQFMQVRLFPRMQGARFERRIHEQISSSMASLGVPYVEHQSIVIFHAGYNDAATNRKKALRNKPLIMAEVAENPQSSVLLLSLADCHTILGETKEALAAYERIVADPDAKEKHPDIFVQAHFNIGLVYRSIGKNAIAKIWFEKTIRLDATRTEAYYLLGLLAEADRDRDAAFSYFLTCSRKKPPVRQTATDSEKIRIDSVYRIGQYLFDKGMFEQCQGLIAPAADKYPNVVNFHTLLGKVFLCQEKITDAARHFMTSLSLMPVKNPESCKGMAAIYLMLNDKSKAREFLARAEESVQEQENGKILSGMDGTPTSPHHPCPSSPLLPERGRGVAASRLIFT